MADTKIKDMEGGALGATPVGTEQLWPQNAAGTIDYHWTLDDLSTWIQAEVAAANAGIRYAHIMVFGPSVEMSVGNGKGYYPVRSALNGMNLVQVHALNITAGVTGTADIMVHNLTDTVDMLSTGITIDSTETGSDTAAIPPVINLSNDDVATNDVLRLDVDAVQTTIAQGLIVTLGFQLP